MTEESFQKQWSAMASKFQGTADKLGMNIDEKIIDRFVALNLLGISTTQSCEGHLYHSLAGPWVILGVPNTSEVDEISKLSNQAYQEAEEIKGANPTTFINDPRYGKSMDNYRDLYQKTLIPTNDNILKIIPLLDDFYHNRNTPVISRLILSDIDSNVPRLHNQGLYLQEMSSPEAKAQNLQNFQTEFISFTEFLKQKLHQ